MLRPQVLRDAESEKPPGPAETAGGQLAPVRQVIHRRNRHVQEICDLSRGHDLIARERGPALRTELLRGDGADRSLRFHHQKRKQICWDVSRTFWDIFKDVLGRLRTFLGTFPAIAGKSPQCDLPRLGPTRL